jgi:hypothetical protein
VWARRTEHHELVGWNGRAYTRLAGWRKLRW